MREPKTIKALLREHDIPLGGAIRADVAKVLDDGLFGLWEGLVNADGGEHAAVAMFTICSRDPSFVVPYWLELAFRRHRAAVVDAVDSGAVAAAAYALSLDR